jgi:SAM-dependent methyltransferase
MKNPIALGHRLPIVKVPLFGDRARFGLESDRIDPMWDEWEEACTAFYTANQRSGLGKTINDAGYRILEQFDFTGKTIVEIGPGYAPHLPYFKTKPAHYIIIDIREEFLTHTAQKLTEMGISHETHLIDPDTPNKLPLPEDAADVLVTFYSLEHLYPLEDFLHEYRRILRPNAHVVGAIPAKGGLAWGLGRFLTSRRWLKRNTQINPEKLICWEHPNFSDHILRSLGTLFQFEKLRYWPLGVPLIDTNLIVSFIAKARPRG